MVSNLTSRRENEGRAPVRRYSGGFSVQRVGIGKRVLVVDDNPAIRSFVRAHLAPLGFVFSEADSADGAMEIIRASTTTLIIADINVPGADGIGLVRRLRASEGLHRAIPVILITRHRSVGLHDEALKAGANRFLFKPVTPDALVSAVLSVFRAEAL
jgi:CheY-like chemotaxis protein